MKLQCRLRPFYGALTLGTNRTRNLARSFSSEQSSSFAIKNVTRSNFDSALADLRRLVRAADFVSVDLEMTGVVSAPWREAFEFDRFDIRYLKFKDSAEKFAVVQVGVCPFRWDQPKQRFVAHPHNFYVFPRQEFPVDGPSSEFLCQTASIDFLAKHQFDFNTCIGDGVSYLSRRQEDEALRHLTLAYEDKLSETFCNSKEIEEMPLLRMADVFFTERLKNRITEWCNGLLQERSNIAQLQGFSDDLKLQFQTTFYKMRPALMLNGFTSHQMKLIQLVAKKHFQDLVYVRVDGEDSFLQHLLVYTDSENDRSIFMKEVKVDLQREAETKIKAAVGFRQVIDLLSSEKKLIVGHNCFLDIAQIHSKFLGPLPSTVEEFVSSVHEHFPCIIDTKILLGANNVLRLLMEKRSTSLSKAFALMCPQLAFSYESSSSGFRPCAKVEVPVDDMSSCKWNSGAKHEAGYDAFMTRCIFAQSCTHLGVDFKSHLPPSRSSPAGVVGSGTPEPSCLALGTDSDKMAPNQKIRIKLSSYWAPLIENSCKQIMDAARKTNARTAGPIPLPTKRRLFCVLKSPHVHKKARNHFETRTHQRLIDIMYPTAQTVDSLMRLDLPAGVDVELKL